MYSWMYEISDYGSENKFLVFVCFNYIEKHCMDVELNMCKFSW